MTAPTRTRRLFAGTALALLLAGSTAACSSSGSDADDKTTTTAAKTTTTDDSPTTTGDDGPTTTEGTDDGPTTTTGDDEPSDDADAQDYVDALKASFDSDDSDEFYEPGQVDCLAESYVEVLGVDNLVDAGVTPDELATSQGDGGQLPDELGVDEDKANELYDQFDNCDIDILDTFKKVFTEIGGQELTPEQTACLDEVLTEENVRASFVADFSGEPLDPDPLDEAQTCFGF